jgi:hypothetical protein
MKTYKTLVAITMAVAATALADARTNAAGKVRRKLNRAQMEQRWYAKTGGELQVPGSQRGKIVFVNAQDRAGEELIAEVASTFAGSHKLAISVERGAFSLPRPEIRGEASLFIVNDVALPAILHAPEDRWTMVNVARLGEGRGEKRQFFSERVKKEVTRGFCLLAGAQTSNYPNSLLTSVTKPDELDKFLGCRLQFDVQERFVPYLKGLGVTPATFTTYLAACQEGWAPQPTNDVQRAIWDKVHSIPDKPINIEYDPKKDK